MKYATKEWYERMQKTSLHFSLKTSKRALTFSEDYYRELYTIEEASFLKQQEKFSQVKFEDVYPEEFPVEDYDVDPLNPGELEKAKKQYMEMREKARVNYENRPPFDRDAEIKNFRLFQKNKIQRLTKDLPRSVLDKVADLRVLALDRCTKEVKREITAYCHSNERAGHLATAAYAKAYKKTFKKGEPLFAEQFYFHDCSVVSCRTKGKDRVLSLDNSGGFTQINKIIFKNCQVLKQDRSLSKAWWLYDEVYKTDQGYEIHVLLENKGLIDFIVSVTDVEYRQ